MFSSLRLRFARPTPIAALRAGAVIVEGRIVCDATLALSFAPLPAVAAEWWIESHRRVAEGRRRPMWVAIDGGARAVDFWLEDATGRVRVEADPEWLRVLRPRHDTGPVRDRRGTRWVARWLASGDRVRVRGLVEVGADGLVLAGSPERPLEILLRRRPANDPQ